MSCSFLRCLRITLFNNIPCPNFKRGRNEIHETAATTNNVTSFVEYFRSFGEISNPKEYKDLLAKFPDDPSDICNIVQGLIIHPFWIDKYGAKIEQDRINRELQARNVVDILDNIHRLQDGPLQQARPPGVRTVGTCRNFSLLLCSVLRSKGVAARLRCGFATYFDLQRYEDHWICEYWSDNEKYWVRVDPQLDDLHVRTLNITFDPCDVPMDAYLYAGEAWTMCRKERADPQAFGILEISGLGFIKGNIVRDILALNKIETLPWDLGWGILYKDYLNELDRSELGYVDRLARCSANSLVHLAHSFFQDDEKIRFPQDWNWTMAPTIAELTEQRSRL